MGRIKSALVKRTAFKLMKEVDGFNGEFENDKKMLGSTMPSKKLRNKIAGYIARLRRQQILDNVNTQGN